MLAIRNQKGQILCRPGTTTPYLFHNGTAAEKFMQDYGIEGFVADTDEEGAAVDEAEYQRQQSVDYWLSRL